MTLHCRKHLAQSCPWRSISPPPGRWRLCGPVLAASLVLVSLFIFTPQDIAQEPALQHVTLHVGFTRSSFHDVNVNDAAAAFRIFAQTAALKRGYRMDVDVQLFDDSAACEAEIKKGYINLAVLDTWDFLHMNIREEMDPAVVHLEEHSVFRHYLLLVRHGAGLTNLASLRNADLLVLEGEGGDISRAWLDSLLLTQHLGSKETFFHALKSVAKPTAAVLPVFFGTKPACLVDSESFQLMSELNPQIGSNLVSIAVSEPYLESVTCLSKSGWPSDRARQDLINGMLELGEERSGRQILELFRVNRLTPFQDKYLDTVKKLAAAVDPSARQHLAAMAAESTDSSHEH